ncbi:hypothetical protein QLQ12_24370 [Actinoplanes sp. NEAU-A12]|uniref:Uncharacterized protein n=1 Tax=Actinoplanes sandaracinus TaxID=3045177 RepID=A0ABT6WPU2_9ACTN|nr:hypothetical protein [Actinoplanes sandaracinus]MDI6101761.1 hypothetical protein [Actinoplanes sandaracinus]
MIRFMTRSTDPHGDGVGPGDMTHPTNRHRNHVTASTTDRHPNHITAGDMTFVVACPMSGVAGRASETSGMTA